MRPEAPGAASQVLDHNIAGSLPRVKWVSTGIRRNGVSWATFCDSTLENDRENASTPSCIRRSAVSCRGWARPAPSKDGILPPGGEQALPLRRPPASPPGTKRLSMGDVVGGFKSLSTIALNKFMSRPGAHPLHENFYEHIIRNVHELQIIREYIGQNPQRWLEDPENSENVCRPF